MNLLLHQTWKGYIGQRLHYYRWWQIVLRQALLFLCLRWIYARLCQWHCHLLHFCNRARSGGQRSDGIAQVCESPRRLGMFQRIVRIFESGGAKYIVARRHKI